MPCHLGCCPASCAAAASIQVSACSLVRLRQFLGSQAGVAHQIVLQEVLMSNLFGLQAVKLPQHFPSSHSGQLHPQVWLLTKVGVCGACQGTPSFHFLSCRVIFKYQYCVQPVCSTVVSPSTGHSSKGLCCCSKPSLEHAELQCYPALPNTVITNDDRRRRMHKAWCNSMYSKHLMMLSWASFQMYSVVVTVAIIPELDKSLSKCRRQGCVQC